MARLRGPDQVAETRDLVGRARAAMAGLSDGQRAALELAYFGGKTSVEVAELVLVAPMILGTGPAGLVLPPIARVEEALRPAVSIHRIAGEVLFDCDFSAQRVAVFRAGRAGVEA